MVDLSKTIEPKSDQLNADDLIGRKLVITITKVSRAESPEQPISIGFEGDNGKPWKPCKSMRRVLVQGWGADGQQYIGRMVELYRDDKVLFGGVEVGGIRISRMSHLKDNKPLKMALTASRARRSTYIVEPIIATAAPAPAAAPLADASPEVKAAGLAAAQNGVDAYSGWLQGLSPEVKETVRRYHREWSQIAKDINNEAPI